MKKNLFRDNLRKFRENSNLSQKDFSETLGINATTYRNYENSDREPDYDTLILLSQSLGVSIDSLLGISEPQSEPKESKETKKQGVILNEKLLKLCDIYHALDPINQAALMERAETLLELQNKLSSNDKNSAATIEGAG